MSEIEEVSDDTDIVCPYCGGRYQREAEDYHIDQWVETCDECGKRFHARTVFEVRHLTQPDCELNGGEHTADPSYPQFCSICNKLYRFG